MQDILELQERIAQFSKERDWDQFHNGKDLALGLSIEDSELLEAYLWKSPEDVNVEKVKEELADVLNYALQIATKYDLDVKQIVMEKLAKNAYNTVQQEWNPKNASKRLIELYNYLTTSNSLRESKGVCGIAPNIKQKDMYNYCVKSGENR